MFEDGVQQAVAPFVVGVDVVADVTFVPEAQAFGYGDGAGVLWADGHADAVQTQVAEGFRRFEFDLRRKLGAAGADQMLLGGSDDTPAAYKKLVEDYYRALAKERKK